MTWRFLVLVLGCNRKCLFILKLLFYQQLAGAERACTYLAIRRPAGKLAIFDNSLEMRS